MLVVTGIVVLVCLLIWHWRPKRPHNFPPGPPTFLVFGNAVETIQALIGNFSTMLQMNREKYGNVLGMVLPNKATIVHIFSFDDIKEACAKAEFSARPGNFSILVRSFNQKLGILFNDGPIWMEHRRFALRHLRDLGFGKRSMESIVHDEFEELSKEMMEDIGSPMKVNFRFNLTVLNILWKLVADIRFDRSDPMALKYVKTVNEFFTVTGPQNPMNFAPWLRHIIPEWSGYSPLVRHREMTSELFRNLMREHKKTLDPANPRDLIDQFLLEMEKDDAAARNFTELNLSVVGMDLFIAGMETTSTSLSWALLLMVMYPDVQTKVQQEIDTVLMGSLTSYEDRLKMPYTEAVLMEITRMSSTLPNAAPHCTDRDTEFKGYHFPKDTLVIMHLEEVHMDPEYWGDPTVFRPERFLNGDGTVRKEERLIPFGIGRRFCLGETLARMEMFMLFVALLQRFRFTAAPGQTLSMETKFAIVKQPNEFFVNYKRRD